MAKSHVMKVDKGFKEVLDSYRKAIELNEGYKPSYPQATARLGKKLFQDKKWW
jgi:hypothetical protein